MWPQRLQWPSFAKRKYKVPTFVQTLGLLVFGWLLGIGTLKIYSEATSPRLSQVHAFLGPQVSGLLRHAELSGSQPPSPEEHSMQPVVPPVTLGRTEHSAGARVDKNETEAPTFKAGAFCFAQHPPTAFDLYATPEAAALVAQIAEIQATDIEILAEIKSGDMLPSTVIDQMAMTVDGPIWSKTGRTTVGELQSWFMRERVLKLYSTRDELIEAFGDSLAIPIHAGGMPDFKRSFDVRKLYASESWSEREFMLPKDFMLEHLQAMPDPAELFEPSVDHDAIALQARLHELATRPLSDLSQATIVPAVPAYGVGASISSLVYPVLEALAKNATLFAPSMHKWTSPSCVFRDLTCYFASLPSLRGLTSRLMAERRRKARHSTHRDGATTPIFDRLEDAVREKTGRGQQVGRHEGRHEGRQAGRPARKSGETAGRRSLHPGRGQIQMLLRLHAHPRHNDTQESFCADIRGLGLGCPELLLPRRRDWRGSDGAGSGRGKAVQAQRPHGEASSAQYALQPEAQTPGQHPAAANARISRLVAQRGEGVRRLRRRQTVLLSSPRESISRTRETDEEAEKRRVAKIFRQLAADMHEPISLEHLTAENEAPLGLSRGIFNLSAADDAVVDEVKLFAATGVGKGVGRGLDRRWLRRGRFWLMSQVIKFLTTPNDRLKARLDRERLSMGDVERPILGLHVRKGDACGDRGECRDLKDYMPTVNQMIERYGYKTVFLATPDPTVIDAIKSFPNVTFKFVRTTNTTMLMKRLRYRKIDDAIAAGVVDAGNEFEAAMVSNYLLSESDGFVGGFSSNAARVAYSMLAAGPTGCLKPFHSFDINWCAAFQKGGPRVLRRGNESCEHAKKARGMPWLPCQISC